MDNKILLLKETINKVLEGQQEIKDLLNKSIGIETSKIFSEGHKDIMKLLESARINNLSKYECEELLNMLKQIHKKDLDEGVLDNSYLKSVEDNLYQTTLNDMSHYSRKESETKHELIRYIHRLIHR